MVYISSYIYIRGSVMYDVVYIRSYIYITYVYSVSCGVPFQSSVVHRALS